MTERQWNARISTEHGSIEISGVQGGMARIEATEDNIAALRSLLPAEKASRLEVGMGVWLAVTSITPGIPGDDTDERT